MRHAFALGLAALLASADGAAASCSLCATSVVVNSELAGCFLSAYDDLAKRGGAAIAVDLSDCGEGSRALAEPLPDLQAGPLPDTQFILSRPQLDCLKGKLQQPGVALDPTATIDLAQCP